MTFTDVWHPSKKKYKEWWYFALFCDNGAFVSGVFGVNDKDSHIWLSVKNRKHKYLKMNFPMTKFKASKKSCNVQIDKNYLIEQGDKIIISIKEKNVELKAEIKKLVKWKNNSISAKLDNYTARWIVPCLRGSIKGYLKMGRSKETLGGIAFHDHVWHDIQMDPKTILNTKCWHWGILYSNKYSILFVHVDHKIKPFKFLCINDGKKTISSNDIIKDKDLSFKTTKKDKKDILEITYKKDKICVDIIEKHLIGPRIIKWLIKPFVRKQHALGHFTFKDEQGVAYTELLEHR